MPGEGAGELHAHELLEHVFEHALQMLEHILLLHKAHFHIHLSKLRLAVCTKVLIPEAPSHLIVPVNAAHHQELLEDLRGLGQRIEFTVVNPGGNQIVSCALGGRLGEHGCLHRQEAVGIQIVLGTLLHPVPELQASDHLRSAEIQIPVLEPQGLIAGTVLHREGQRVSLGDHLQLLCPELYRAGFQLGVHRLRVTLPHIAVYGNDRFVFQLVRRRKLLRRKLSGIKHHLKDPFPVSQVNKDYTAHVPLGLHPAADGLFPANGRLSHGSAVNRALEHENHPF